MFLTTPEKKLVGEKKKVPCSSRTRKWASLQQNLYNEKETFYFSSSFGGDVVAFQLPQRKTLKKSHKRGFPQQMLSLSHLHQRYACIRIGILEIKDQLCQIFNTINIMMRWRWDQSNSRCRISSFGNATLYLLSRQFTTFTRFSPLGHFDL